MKFIAVMVQLPSLPFQIMVQLTQSTKSANRFIRLLLRVRSSVVVADCVVVVAGVCVSFLNLVQLKPRFQCSGIGIGIGTHSLYIVLVVRAS